jgi:hypothetical protein
MKTQLSNIETFDLPDGTCALTGRIDGPPLHAGWRGRAATSSRDIEVEIIGVAVVDPNLVKPNMERVLVRVLKGNNQSLKGATLIFD